MNELLEKAKTLKTKLHDLQLVLNLSQKKQQLLELEDQMNNKNFWDDQKNATAVSKKAVDIKEEIVAVEDLQKNVEDMLVTIQDSIDSGDNSLEQDIEKKIDEYQGIYNELEFKALLSGKHDHANAVVAIHAGTGGTDAQDWAQMLERMLMRYAENKKFKVSELDRQTGSEAGIKSSVFEVKGETAYGYLKSEAGVHRLVRISPFDAEKMRHTSFALVEVLPVFVESEDTSIKEEDLEIDTFKSSGHGGQSVNTTDSAVRIKHVPTGIVVSCQNERSQLQNKQTAMRILSAKVKSYQEAELEEERKKIRGEFSEAVWGNQARSYVLHPYQLVKDHRTEHETQEVEKLLDGDLDSFVEAYLKTQAKQ